LTEGSFQDLHPKVSAESKRYQEENHLFHRRCEAAYHIINMYMERIAPNLARSSREVMEMVRRHRDPNGFLSDIKTHYYSHAIRFNAGTGYHKDDESCWSGFDAIAVFGEYERGELHLRDAGYSFPSRPSDLFFIRGAGFYHDAIDWKGRGRMVLALFADRTAFFRESVERPEDLDPIYRGRKRGAFRQQYPYITP
jgi:hypothetical protein